jgi:NTP pyrophosphatase (non-canonical NTP hydrolase)
MLADELADIIGLAIINADLFGIDLEKAIKEKWLNKYVR